MNELTVFVVTVTLLSMFLYMDGWPAQAERQLAGLFANVAAALRGPGWPDIAKGVAGLFFFPLAIAASLIVPLFLPFTRVDWRRLCVPIVLLDAGILLVFNLRLAREQGSLLHSILALYLLAWFIHAWVVRDLDSLISRAQARGLPAIIAASISAAVVFVAVTRFSVEWVSAYSLAVVAVSLLASAAPEWFIAARRGSPDRE